MGALQSFERRLESLISGVFAKAFRSAVQPVEISAALQREVDNNAQIMSRDRRLVPNDFHVELSQTDLDRLAPYDSAMARDMSAQLQRYAEQQSYVFPGPVAIHYEAADDLTTGRFRVRSKATASVTGEETYDTGMIRTTRAYLDVNGSRHPLRPPGIIVGRGSDAHVRINDPGISRQHVEFAVAMSREGGLTLHARDLGSTNGMTVDGHRVTHAAVGDGSQVTIGKTTMTVVLTDALEPDAGGHGV